MNDLTRYEKELAQELNKLPLPNEDAAWDDMSKLLDENHDKGGIPPNRGNIILGSILGALLIGALLFFIYRKSTDNKQVNDQTTISTGTKDSHLTTDNTNSTLNNKDAVTDKSVSTDANTSKTINSNSATPGQDNNQNRSITTYDNKNKLNSVGQITNNNKADNNYSNNERTTSTMANRQTTNTADIKSYNSGKQSIKNSNEINNSALVIADDVKIKNASGKNIGRSHHINNIRTEKVSDKNIDKTDETIATDEFVTNNKTRENNNSISENVSPATGTTTTVKHRAHHIVTSRSATKTSVQNNVVVSNSDAAGNNNATIDQSDNNTALTTKASVRNHNNHISNNNSSANNDITATNDLANNTNTTEKVNSKKVKHTHTTPAYYEESIAAKNSKRSIKKKNSIKTTTAAAKTRVTISGSDVEESDDAIDTAQLIKIGQNVLAKKKAKHPILKDTSATKPLVVVPKAADTTTKKKENKKRFDISVGLGEQQAIRLNCDCEYPNDAYTKSSLVTDYIPSVYVKIQPSKKWFVQAELKYKAPQYMQEQLYQKNASNQLLNYVTSTSVLKKVYYNQIPISFDYVIIPNLSIGVGVIYNNFAGQVSQQDVRKSLYGGTDSTISSSTSTSTNNDSLTFRKNSFQGLIEGQYEWNRFTFGARYAIGLQNYLKYTDPSGNLIEKKNDALIVFIRFELWDNKRKK